MDLFTKLTRQERKEIIRETANSMDLSPTIIEKDFWVCWTLGKIADMSQIEEHITFKGGTSLSKVFHLIDRFSEDIDLSFGRSYLGFGGEKDPEQGITKKQIEKRIEELKQACVEEINHRFMPTLSESIANEINKSTDSWSLEIDDNDPQTILFYYPRSMDAGLENYIQPVIKIEMGARSDDWPTINGIVNSYIAETFKDLWPQNLVSIKTLASERTFWEKATILHAEYHRPDTKNPATRSSRHYYDLYQMHKKGVSSNAFQQIDLLDRVAKHKSIFFRSSWANYEEAKPGTLRIIPKLARMSELKQDYIKMKDMFFGNAPAFDDIMDGLKKLENSINSQLCISI